MPGGDNYVNMSAVVIEAERDIALVDRMEILTGMEEVDTHPFHLLNFLGIQHPHKYHLQDCVAQQLEI